MTISAIRTFALGTLVLVSALAPASAQVIDQNNPGAINGAFTYLDNWQGQTFIPTATNSAGAGLNIYGFLGGATDISLSIQLWSGIPGVGPSALLASASTMFSLGAGQFMMVDGFWSPVVVTPGQTYFLAYLGIGTGANLLASTHTHGASTYPFGGVFANSSTVITDPWIDYTLTSGGFDLSFEEFSTGRVTAVTPEPATMMLVGTGLVGLAGIRRRKRSNVVAT